MCSTAECCGYPNSKYGQNHRDRSQNRAGSHSNGSTKGELQLPGNDLQWLIWPEGQSRQVPQNAWWDHGPPWWEEQIAVKCRRPRTRSRGSCNSITWTLIWRNNGTRMFHRISRSYLSSQSHLRHTGSILRRWVWQRLNHLSSLVEAGDACRSRPFLHFRTVKKFIALSAHKYKLQKDIKPVPLFWKSKPCKSGGESVTIDKDDIIYGHSIGRATALMVASKTSQKELKDQNWSQLKAKIIWL